MHPNSIANLNREGRPTLPYKPDRLQVLMDPELVKKIDRYKTIANIKTKNGRNRAIAELAQTALAIALTPDLRAKIQQFQAEAQVESMDEAIVCLIEMGLQK